MFNVFTRTFWKEAETPGWPNNLEPKLGRKHYLAHGLSWSAARAMANNYNKTHKSGRYSRKAELEECTR